MQEDRRDPNRPDAPGGPTADQLRDDIDSGRTRDKVANPDPAAAPLGTDAEAAGASPTSDQVATARAHETGRVGDRASASRAAPQTARRPNRTVIWVIVAAVVAAIILAIIF